MVEEEGAMQHRGPCAGTPCLAHGRPREAVIPGIRGQHSVTSHALLKPADKVDCNTMEHGGQDFGVLKVVVTGIKCFRFAIIETYYFTLYG